MAGKPQVSTYQVAAALGVSVTTVKRWVDEDILIAHRTPGGHRKLFTADVLQFIRENNFPRADLTQLNVDPLSQDPHKLCDELFEAMKRGDREGTYCAILGARDAGLCIPQIADIIVAPALHRVGEEWAKGNLDVLEEHRGSALCIEALHVLRQRIDTGTEKDRPIAVGGCPEGDYSVIGSQLTELVLLELGWQTVNLGPHTPISSFTKALRDVKPRLIWISASHQLSDDFLEGYAGFSEQAEQAGTEVVLGGHAVTEELRNTLRSTAFGRGLSDLATFASTLYVRPRKPRRGRPPRTQPQL